MKTKALASAEGPAFPSGVLRLDYQSPVDDRRDWALLWPGAHADWVVCLHGHGSHGDQLYTRRDIRDTWLGAWRPGGYGILTPNLRDNAWMSPAAAVDLHALLGYVRDTHKADRFFLVSGSMGGTGNLIYAVLHPEDVAGVVARGAATDLATYHAWCRERNSGTVNEIADAIEAAYGGPPHASNAAYAIHSAQKHADALTMPAFLVHGDADTIIPVSQARALAHSMADRASFRYAELPGGGHDAPLRHMESFDWVVRQANGADR